MAEKNYTKLKIISIILLSMGMLLIGFAITGRVIGNTSSDYCTNDINCSNGKICCIIPQKADFYMCYESQVCNDLKNNLKDFSKEIPIKKDYSQYMNLGIAILVLAIVLLIIIYLIEKKEKRRKLKDRFK